MITIAEINKAEIGRRFGGVEFDIKTYKKMWQVNSDWVQQVIIMDSTGEMPADVKIGKKNIPLRGHCGKIKIVVAEIQEAEYLGKNRRKLYIDQWENANEPITADEMLNMMPNLNFSEEEATIRSKIKCLLVCAKVGTGIADDKILAYAKSDIIKELIDSILKGEKMNTREEQAEEVVYHKLCLEKCGGKNCRLKDRNSCDDFQREVGEVLTDWAHEDCAGEESERRNNELNN